MERLSYFYSEAANAALAGNAAFTGAARGPGPGAAPGSGISGINYFNASFDSDQGGTAYLDLSNDGQNWYAGASQPFTANNPVILTVPLLAAFFRARVVNGATPATALYVNTSMTGA